MNKETTDLIKQLADKLGTTAEHLWGVLVKQAPISASVDLVASILLVIVFIAVWVRTIKLLYRKKDEYDFEEKSLFIGIACVVSAIIIPLISRTLTTTLAGFYNPEYWALRQLIK